jgi:hypothetical protein
MSNSKMPPDGSIPDDGPDVPDLYVVACPYCQKKGVIQKKDMIYSRVCCINPSCTEQPKTDWWANSHNPLYAWRDREFI